MKLAISGKGGVGKTTVAAGLALLYASKGYRVWAIDADPDANLGWALGYSDEELAKQIPLVNLKEEIEARIGRGPFFSINPRVDDLLEKNSLEKENMNYIKMGGVKEGGSSCYCPENALLRAVLSNLLFDRQDVVIMDMAAGIEHLTRGTARGVDAMFIVVEPGRTSINTARTIIELAKDLGLEKVGILGNKVRSPREKELIESSLQEIVWGYLPYAEEIQEMGFKPVACYPKTFLEVLGEISQEWDLAAKG